jgi:hypothetical protein
MSGPGTTTIVDDAAAAILAHTTAMNALFNPVQALKTPGTPASTMYVAASSLNDMSSQMSDLVTQTKDINANLQILIQAINAMGSAVQLQTTTAQLAYIDQVKNNSFNQKTTNAALERANLPPTVVTTGDLQNMVTSTVTDVANLNIQSQVVSATNYGIAAAQGYAIEQSKWLLQKAWVESGAAGIWQTVKKGWNKLFNIAEDTKGAIVEKKAQVRTNLLGVPESQLPNTKTP